MRLVLLLLFLTSSCDVFCQTSGYVASALDIRNGLSNSQVNCIYKDRQGFMWFGTLAGLNRYDGYSCKVFKRNDTDTNTLVDDYVRSLYEGPDGNLWIQTRSDLNIYDPVTEKVNRHPEAFLQRAGLPVNGVLTVVHFKDTYYFVYGDLGVYAYEPGRKPSYLSVSVNVSGINHGICSAAVDSKGYIWLIRYDGLLEQLDPAHNRILRRTDIRQRLPDRPPVATYAIFPDAQDEIWLNQPDQPSGLYLYHPLADSLVHFSKDIDGRKGLSSNVINGLIQDDLGLIWVIADHGGITLIDKTSLTCRALGLEEGVSAGGSPPDYSINAIDKDDIGHIWLGTSKKGVFYYDFHQARFPLFRHDRDRPNSLGYDDVNGFAEDKKGNLWIATNGGGLVYFDRSRNIFRSYTHDRHDPRSLCNDIVISLCLDHEGKLWIGTYFGGLDCYDGLYFTHYRHQDAVPASLADDRVYSLLEDRNNQLWIGTMGGGLDRYDRQKKIFEHHRPGGPHAIHSLEVTSLLRDTAGNLWIGTTWGMDKLEKATGEFVHFYDRNSGLSYNNVNGLFQDRAGNIWVATRHGLNVLQGGRGRFTSFFSRDGLTDDYTLNVLEDAGGDLWVSTKNGLSRARVSREANGKIGIRCTGYDEDDGLQGSEFSTSSCLKTRANELVFGGAAGFNLFDPAKIVTNPIVPRLVLTNFQLFNKNITAGGKFNGHVVLNRSIAESRQVILPYDENDFSLEFAALSYTHPLRSRYAYRLEGFDKEWMMTDGRSRLATYTNLDPGTYIFHVRGSNNDGVWNDKGLALQVIIRPPFWKTLWAYGLYVLLLAVVLYVARKSVIRRAQLRFQLEEERRHSRHMIELDKMKIKFFTNISHELRTPLSLILAPIGRLIHATENQQQRREFRMIDRNAKRLLHLVNQLLDFRKMEVNELELNPGKGDLISFIHEVCQSFSELADQKRIEFSCTTDVPALMTWFDEEKIERILFNLLSNAFKFTPAAGKVTVHISRREEKEGSLLDITVTDTGIGIAPEQLPRIFDRFFQSNTPAAILNQGSGIGLGITKEFVEMCGGTIRVESEEGRGTRFSVTLAVKEVVAETSEVPEVSGLTAEDAETIRDAVEGAGTAREATAVTGPRPRRKVLLVEDHEDMRVYLRDNLQEHFTIVEAANGKEGWQKALSSHPDIIVSDVSMPVMDGIELCKKIKSDARTRHIPVIMLTAVTGEQQELKALATGPNDYISKPFHLGILVSRINNLLDFKQVVQQTFHRRQDIDPAEVRIADPDDDFLKRAMDFIEENMGESALSVDQLSKALFLSRTSLYNKLLALTGKTPVEFIRLVRLKRAAQWLEKSDRSVTEIAYMVGFNHPKYFARYFKEEFQMLPSAYQAEKRSKAK